ncbi:MAG: hypothetical protein H6656_15965 [Ardenticatenaceae bacterium]|nr:hypothetical protein [Ardenticatenaceae bacterium]
MQLLTLPDSCQGSLAILDVDEDGMAEVVRDGCVDGNGRVRNQWNGSEFVNLP